MPNNPPIVSDTFPKSKPKHPRIDPKSSHIRPNKIQTTSPNHSQIIGKMHYTPYEYRNLYKVTPSKYPAQSLYIHPSYTLYIPCIDLVYTLYLPCVFCYESREDVVHVKLSIDENTLSISIFILMSFSSYFP